MSKVAQLSREIRYTKLVCSILDEHKLEYLTLHNSEGRTVEARTRVLGLSLLFKTTPMPESRVLFIVKPTGFKPFVEELDEASLPERVTHYVKEFLL